MLRNLIALAVFLAVVGAVHKDNFTADNSFINIQKRLYRPFWHVDQPTTVQPELYETARAWNLEDHVDAYPKHECFIHEFVQRWKHGLLPRDAIFTPYHPEHIEEVQALFKVFYYAKDFETFYNMAIWAKFHVNSYLYVYTLAAAILHRPDTRHISLPVVHESFPHLFFNNHVMQTAYRVKLGDINVRQVVDGKYHEGADLIIPTNYSRWYIGHDNAEEQLNYFTEDVGLGDFYFHYTQEFPYWMDSDNDTIAKAIRGELYYFGHKQLVARYYLERLSNGLGEIENIDWNRPIVTGYYPTINLPNGMPFAQRPSYAPIPQHMYSLIQEISQIGDRISSAIDTGYVMDHSRPSKLVDIYTPEGLNIIGNIIEGNSDSYNREYYGSFDHIARRILGFSPEAIDKNHVVPSTLEYAVTSLRDPAFYRIYNKILSYFILYKERLPKYIHADVEFSGVKIDSVAIDNLTTYFDNFGSIVNNGIPVKSSEDAKYPIIKVRQPRLNHKPFTYDISVTSDKDTKGTVRIFLGPKYDVHGHEIDFVQNWVNFMEMDNFVVDLKTGSNKIERSSFESIYTTPDQISTTYSWKKLTKAAQCTEPFQYNGQLFGFPDRLILPKGRKDGLPLKVFIHIAPFVEDEAVTINSHVWGTTVVDGKPMGYPLDRPVQRHVFHGVTNVYFKDVVVFHKEIEELNQTGQSVNQ